MKSLTGKFSSARGWALLLIMFLGAGLVVAACGDEEVPTPTTPAPPPPTPPPAPPPEPEPTPEPPAVPVGLRISATGLDFVEWSWTPVADVGGYDAQFSANEAFTDEDEIIPRTAEEISYRREGLDPETSAYLRVRSASGIGEDRITSDWSTHVTGMTLAPEPPPQPPATPTGLEVSATTETSITWTWNPVDGAVGYVVQANMDEMFDATDTVLFNGLSFTTETSYTATDLEPETAVYVRVAAGIGTPTDPLLSAFTIHVTGMTMAAAPEAPAVPANLRDTDRGSDYIEWQWDEVEGADGYHAQFSTSSGFSGSDDFFLQGMSNTTQRVANLEAEADGYLRVRAYAGTLADPVYGEWSDSDKASTDEPPPPPPPDPLDAPDDVGTSNPQDNSITVSWDAVDDAEEYEVEQRSNGGSWVDANCGSETGSNIVTDTSCVASGLDEDTPYDFRVRAFPGSDDDTKTESAWSDFASAETTGVVAPPVVTTTSELNLEWKSDGTSITWDWDPVEDRELRERTEHLVQVIAQDGSCADIDYPDADDNNRDWTDQAADNTVWKSRGKNISLTRGSTAELSAGSVKGLCVVRTWLNELANDVKVRAYGTPELVWASTVPSSPDDVTTTPNPEVRTDETKRTTTFLEWTYEADAGFRYPGQLVSVTGDDADPTCETSGEEVTSSTAAARSGTSRHRETSGLKTYRKYALCLQALNEHGASELAQIGDGNTGTGVRTTLPAAPKSVTYSSSDSWVIKHATRTDLIRRLVWEVPTTEGTPDAAGKFDSRVILSTKNSIQSTECAAEAASGSNSLSDSNEYVRIPVAQVSPGDTSTGFEVVATHDTDLLTINGGATVADSYYFYACVRADPDGDADSADDDHGPWKISSAKSFARTAPAVPTLTVTTDSTDANNPVMTLTWKAVDGADTYTVELETRSQQEEEDGTLGSVSQYSNFGDWTEWATQSDPCDTSEKTARRCEWNAGSYDEDPSTGRDTRYASRFRIQATASTNEVGSDGLSGKWSTWRTIDHPRAPSQ